MSCPVPPSSLRVVSAPRFTSRLSRLDCTVSGRGHSAKHSTSSYVRVGLCSSSSSSSSSSSRNEYYLGGTIALLLQDHRTMSTTGSL